VPDVLADPVLHLFSGQSAIAENNDWETPLPLCAQSGQACGTPADIAATGLAPSASLEAAILITLNPGPYTAIVSGVGATTGVALVDVFECRGPEAAALSARSAVASGGRSICPHQRVTRWSDRE
jgi:hypothetical protein